MRGRTTRVLLVVVTALLGIVFSAVPAAAHASLEQSRPEPGSIVAQPPTEVVLDFSEPVTLSLGELRVVGPDGKRVDTGEHSQRKGGAEVVIPLKDDLDKGSYLVSYRVVSADSHPVSGGYGFSIGAPSANPPTLDGASSTGAATSASEDPLVRGLFAAARYLGFAGLVLLIGPVLFLLVLWPRRLDARPIRRLVWTGWGLALGAGIAGLVLQVPYAAGTSLAGVSLGGLADVVNTRFGSAHLLRVGLLLAGIPLLSGLLDRHRDSRGHRLLAGLAGIGVVATWGWAGHAGSSDMPAISMLSDTVHVAAMAIWLGGLVVLVTNLLPRGDARELRLALPEWSRWAMLAVCALIASGTVQALMEVGGWSGLVGTTYGRLLLAKLALVVLILAFANAARLWVRRHYTATVAHAATREALERPTGVDDDPPPARELRGLRRSVLAEAGLAAVVLAVTAVLVQTTPGRTAVAAPAPGAPSAAAPRSFTKVVVQGDVSLGIDLDPAQRGINRIHLFASKADGTTPLRVLEWTVTASLPAKGLNDVTVPVQPVTTSHVIGTVTLPASGDWTFRITMRTSDIDATTIEQTIPVA